MSASIFSAGALVSADTGAADPAVSETYDCPSTVAVRDVVYLSGAGTVDKARADSAATMPAIGVVLSKPSSTTCVVKAMDSVDGFTGLTADTLQYVSPTTAGALTETAPTTAGQLVQQVGFSRNTTTLVVQLGTTILL